jgi:DNA mismatch repair protein MutS
MTPTEAPLWWSRMSLLSILFDRSADQANAQHAQAPPFLVDLNLDQVVDAITANWAEYDLKPFFFTSLQRVESVAYRHEVFEDLENPSLLARVRSFAEAMRDTRVHLKNASEKLHYTHQRNAWFLDAVELYCDAVKRLAADLSTETVHSRGLSTLRDHVTRYAASRAFVALGEEMKELKVDLATVKCCVLVKGSSFTVRKYEGESDYSAEVEATFEKFKQGAVRDYLVHYKTSYDMNHIEGVVLDFVGRLYSDIFSHLHDYCERNANFLDETLVVFDREIHFYIAYLEHIVGFRGAGLRFCYPRISAKSKEMHNCDGFDLALAHKLAGEKKPLVCNDFYLKGHERVVVVTGPNQGGKTTFARTFGQLHYLASLGCPVPGREAQLFLFDRLFTHFEKEEDIRTLRGKLEDDLVRIHRILSQATPRSIIIMNEIFTSTTLQDEIFLSTKLIKKIIALNLICVWVTFVDELASFGPQTVSMVSTVVPDNPAVRTLKIVRRPADGLAYAIAIARKYRLTYDSIKERIKS